MEKLIIVYSMLFLLLALLFWEMWRLKKSVNSIQIRVLINGTRGKSSVTRYIAAGLRGCNVSTAAKITGVEPTLIQSNGTKHIIKRRGGPRVQEQVHMINKVSAQGVKAFSMECMSITPEYQQLESRIFKPHFYVITNIKNDHQEKMGQNLDEQASAICSAVPENCTVVTSEVEYLDLIHSEANNRNCKVIQVDASNSGFLTEVPEHIYAENINIALKVCSLAGYDSTKALAGILDNLEETVSPLNTIQAGGKHIQFLDGFDVNDVPSAIRLIKKYKRLNPISILLNTRSDRPTRTLQFSRWIASGFPEVQKVVITGTHIPKAKRELLKAGLDPEKIVSIKVKNVAQIQSALLNYVNQDELVIGLGNIQGLGLQFRKMLAA